MALKRNLISMGLGQVAFFIIQFGGTVVVARILSPFEMGIFAAAAAIAAMLNVLNSLGLGSYIVREATLGPREVATAFTVNMMIAAGTAMALIAMALGTHFLFHRPEVAHVLALLSLMQAVSIFTLVPYAQLERAQRFPVLVGVNLTRQLSTTFATVGFAAAGQSYLSLPYGQIVGGVICAVILQVAAREHVSLRLSLHGWRNVFKFASQMMFIAGAGDIALRGSELALGGIAGLTNLGLYNRASNLFNTFWDNLHIAAGRALFADLSERRRNGEPLRDRYLVISEIMSALLWPTFCGLAILSQPLFFLVYGEKWLPAALPFSILALSAVVQVSVTMSWELFMVSGELGKQARIELLRNVIGTALFAGACFISLTAAATARVLDQIVSMILYRPHIERITGTTLSDLLPIYRRSAVLTAAAVGPAGALMFAEQFSPHTPIWQVAAAIVLGVTLWIGGLVLLRHPLFLEATKVAAKFKRGRQTAA